MKLIVGLGNPGERYKGTRHNVGFVVMETMVGQAEWKESRKMKGVFRKEEGMVLVKPTTFMNESGRAVVNFKNFYKISLDDLWVVHDDLDLKLGEYKVQKGVGPKVHNGILSIEKQLGNKDFWRVRVGVDGRNGHRSVSGEEYVLGKFSKEEMGVINEVVERVVKELRGVLE